ncbi:secondary thiamine-phosphate synthase enzyme YjbQ [Isachenkonia alkalipeptolytica]|uniref:YjbQ family protein n=1 Tax=Isachenkonia alkalipeptolytica TaxID=2565777 RepID=A0AA43XMT7_9CLOT|nr:secondary thiamine-phosphate synthase enzyme YjbQ [Isachenkonia alkalipeptolytica]NBG89452.1 YjbQ family protein [Isachenkonia alkalipeptolytica]
MFKELSISSSKKSEFIDITKRVQKVLQDGKVKEGTVILFVPHTTAAVTINENADPDVQSDMIQALNRMVPENKQYDHMEGNSPAHVKASVLGMSEIILVHKGELLLGTWQGIFFCEFDGPRTRKLLIRTAQ